MGFEKVVDLDSDTTISLGGRNKKTGKPNPSRIEGYYIGTKDVPSRLSRDGTAKLHVLQTAKGNVGVWGKTHLNRKMLLVPAGAMIRVTHTGMTPTPTGEMYKYEVEVDKSNTIEVSAPSNETVSYENSDVSTGSYESYETEDSGLEEQDLLSEETSYDEVAPTVIAAKPRSMTPDAAKQAKVQALLNRAKVS